MSTTIRATCERCGTVEIALEAAQLEVPLDGDIRNVALMDCPTCGQQLAQRVGERATRLLAAAGIGVTVAQPTPDRTPVSDA